MKKKPKRLTNAQLEEMYLNSYRDIEKIIFNKPATVVILKTGQKGVAKVQPGDKWNRELGFWVAYAKAMGKKTKNPFTHILNCLEIYERVRDLHMKYNSPRFDSGGVSIVGGHGPEPVLPIGLRLGKLK